MTNQPIYEISCCNCSECQAYILGLLRCIERLEETLRPLDPDASQLTHEEEQDANQQIYERLQATASDGFEDARRRLEALAPAPPYKEEY